MSASDTSEIDFVRFVGARVVDATSDERDCKVLVGDVEHKQGLRPDASLLAVSARYGVLFAGGHSGLRWAWLAKLREACAADASPDLASKSLHAVAPDLLAAPFSLSLSADDTLLAMVCTDRTVLVFEVAALLSGATAPALTHALPGTGAPHWAWHPSRADRAMALDDDGSLLVVSGEGATAGGVPTSVSTALVAQDAGLRSASWSADGATIVCGAADGRVVSFTPSAGASATTLRAAGDVGEVDVDASAAVTSVYALSERFTLLGYELPGDSDESPVFAALDAAGLQSCGGFCMPLGRDPPVSGWALLAHACTPHTARVRHAGSHAHLSSRPCARPCARPACAPLRLSTPALAHDARALRCRRLPSLARGRHCRLRRHHRERAHAD